MAYLVEQYTLTKITAARQMSPVELRWMSIGCGTALPTMQAALRAGISPDLFLIDFDKKALAATDSLAKELGFHGALNKRSNINIFNARHLRRLRSELEKTAGLPLLIDLLGIFEYTGKNLGVDSIGFLKATYELLADGGRLILGQMREDRPIPDFAMGTIGWPYIEMRSLNKLMGIIVQTGILPEQCTMYLPSDGIYSVVVVDKP